MDIEFPFLLDTEVEGSHDLVENDAGESLIIEPLAQLIIRMAEFGEESMPENVKWEATIVLPRGVSDASDNGDD